ncbi:YsnF/AvaK domain-containing protein [Anaerobacillus sp. CMMVII]|uniref:YsnF/AvaK domain-containing protein n=1 Tax=Anaerobacillus sp. CMMVII TaxID=2755588 RepID=UPI0021B7D09F|nr:YsnF/AvaK domain-containing protein [Anaerobacillus sp. CMMVII]MCT8136481.1 YsnF/AvaK domain-containing protein [Anaerobacillus sp. CMMVII]
MGFFDLFDENEENRKKVREVDRVADTEFATDEAHLDLREEELDIHKNRVETGDVVLHKDIIEEEQVVNVPVSHDQVVIERRAVDRQPTTEPITDEETVHIPVTAETVEVGKHTVVTGEISAHKRSVEETQQVRDVLHKEVADVETQGTADVISED